MIVPVTFTYDRDFELCELGVRSFRALGLEARGHMLAMCRGHPFTRAQNADMEALGATVIPRDKFIGWTWDSAMVKLEWYRNHIMTDATIGEDDWIVDHDDDVVFMNRRVFDALEPETDFAGLAHFEPMAINGHEGKWHHVSGCAMFMRKRAIRRICELTVADRLDIRRRAHRVAHVFDVVLSLLLHWQGCKLQMLSGHLVSDDPQAALLSGNPHQSSIVHLSGNWTSFGGMPVAGKWGIPAVLRAKGIPRP